MLLMQGEGQEQSLHGGHGVRGGGAKEHATQPNPKIGAKLSDREKEALRVYPVKSEEGYQSPILQRAVLSHLGRKPRFSDRCVRGHLWTPRNSYFNKRGYRICRECRNQSSKRAKFRRACPDFSRGSKNA
jgi:hypothetical protein